MFQSRLHMSVSQTIAASLLDPHAKLSWRSRIALAASIAISFFGDIAIDLTWPHGATLAIRAGMACAQLCTIGVFTVALAIVLIRAERGFHEWPARLFMILAIGGIGTGLVIGGRAERITQPLIMVQSGVLIIAQMQKKAAKPS